MYFKRPYILRHSAIRPHHCIFLSLEPGLIKHVLNREEKSLRHDAMVAKFLDDNKRKRHLQSEFARLQTSSILFNLANVGEIFSG